MLTPVFKNLFQLEIRMAKIIKCESEIEPRFVSVVIHENLKPVTEISNFHESQKIHLYWDVFTALKLNFISDFLRS